MTNPGHIDPGYDGDLRFAIMNVGKKDISLRRGDTIVTLLFFRLSGDARAGWSQRARDADPPIQVPPPDPTRDDVNRLSPDYLDVNSRASTAASKAVKDAQTRNQWIQMWIPLLVSLVGIFGTAYMGMVAIKSDVDLVKKALDLSDPKSPTLTKLQQEIDELKNQQKANANAKTGAGAS